MLNSIGVPPAARTPSLIVLGEPAQVEVAGHRLDPGVGDPDGRAAAARRHQSRCPSCRRAPRRGRDRRRPRSNAGAGQASCGWPPIRARAATRASRDRSRRTWPGSTWRPGTCMFATEISSRSPARSDIHLASTSSASGSRSPASGSLNDPGSPRSTRSGARRSRCRRRRSAGADRAGTRSRRSPLTAVDRDEPELRVHRVLVAETTERRSSRARARRGARGPGHRAAALARRRRWSAPAPALRPGAGPKPTTARRAEHEGRCRERRASTAGGRREEDDPLGVPRDLGEVADHGRLVPRPPSAVGTAAHIPRSSWRRNSSIRRSSSSATSGSPSASRTSPCPGFMRTSFTARLCQRPAELGRSAADPRRVPSRTRPPGPARRRARAGRCRPPRRRSRAPTRAASASSVPAGEEGRERRGMRAAGAVRGAVAGSAGRRSQRAGRRRRARRRRPRRGRR